jgi:Arc/MetJ family transcription regulator
MQRLTGPVAASRRRIKGGTVVGTGLRSVLSCQPSVSYRASIEPPPRSGYIQIMRKTTLVIDDDLIAEAREALGTTGLKETIDAALREAVNARLRREHFERLRSMDGLDLADPEVMEQAWRTCSRPGLYLTD